MRPAGPLSTCHISPCTCPPPLYSQDSMSGPTIICVLATRHFPVNHQPKTSPETSTLRLSRIFSSCNLLHIEQYQSHCLTCKNYILILSTQSEVLARNQGVDCLHRAEVLGSPVSLLLLSRCFVATWWPDARLQEWNKSTHCEKGMSCISLDPLLALKKALQLKVFSCPPNTSLRFTGSELLFFSDSHNCNIRNKYILFAFKRNLSFKEQFCSLKGQDTWKIMMSYIWNSH